MRKVHFVHTSDWHIGFVQYGKIERFNDFYFAAMNTVNKIIDIQPQFVLHTGDIFHHQKPSPGAIRQAVKVLKKLKDNNIPVYMIRGNHDARNTKELQRGGNIISLLDDLGLIQFIDDKVISIDDNIKIMGVGYYTGKSSVYRLDDILDDYDPSDETFDILALHAYIEGQLERNVQISIKEISDYKVDYIGVGHYHIPWKKPKLKIYCPGSSEATSSNDWNRLDLIDKISIYSSFFEIKSEYISSWSSPEVITHNIAVRPKINIVISSDTLEINTLETEILNAIQEKKSIIERNGLDPENSIVKLSVYSEIDVDNLSLLSETEIKNKSNIFHMMSQINGKEKYQDIEIDSFIEQNLEEIILSMLKDEDDPQKFLEIIMDIINMFGEKKHREPSEETINLIINKMNELANGNTLAEDEMRQLVESEFKGGLK